jgi:hypothetical protein
MTFGGRVDLLRFLKSKGYARSIFKLIKRFKSSGKQGDAHKIISFLEKGYKSCFWS